MMRSEMIQMAEKCLCSLSVSSSPSCIPRIMQSSKFGAQNLTKMQNRVNRIALLKSSGRREFLQTSGLPGERIAERRVTVVRTSELSFKSWEQSFKGLIGVRSGIRAEAINSRRQSSLSYAFGRCGIKRKERFNLLQVNAAENDGASVEPSAPTFFQQAAGVLHLAVSLGLFLALDKFLKQIFLAAGIKFPSALFGMFCIFTTLLLTDLVNSKAAAAFINFFQPATMFIQRWLPLFYVPSLVVIPLAVKGIPTEAAAKIALLFVGGWVASLAVAGYTTVMVRKMINTELQTPEYTPKPPPFSDLESKFLAAAVLVFFAIAVYSPTAFGTTAVTTLPFYLAATALGYVFGTNLPANVKRVFHPIITCALSANIAAYIYGTVTGFGFESALKFYMTKQAGNPGAGDIYMGFLGSVILSFAFSMFRQRVLVKRHAAEIFSAVAVSSLFSMYSTAAAGRLIGLSANLTLAIVPRCVTVALALPIAGLLEAGNPSLTAAVVVLTGLIGANFGQALMDKLGFDDPITRGMATATSAHGLGTAALSAKEPEALPFCAIAYALTGIFCSLLVSIPVVQQSLVHVAGQAAV